MNRARAIGRELFARRRMNSLTSAFECLLDLGARLGGCAKVLDQRLECDIAQEASAIDDHRKANDIDDLGAFQ